MPAFEEFSKMIFLNTGLELSPKDIWDCANRAYTLERLFNVREGYTKKDDWLPEQYFDGSMISKLDKEKLRAMLNEYYKLREWDENGVPKANLRQLGLE
jgi:aldehyde:ferredoxin oxidoreductase